MSLFFADDIVLFGLSDFYLQLSLEAVQVLSQKRKGSPLQVWDEVLLQVEQFEYLRVLLNNEKKIELEVGCSNAVNPSSMVMSSR